MFKMKKIVLFTVAMFLLSSIAGIAGDKKKQVTVKVVKDGSYSLGIMITNLNKKDNDKLKVKNGTKILKVFKNSEAEKIGLKKDDIIIKFDGKKIKTPNEIGEIVKKYTKEKKVEITVLRNKKSKNFTALMKKTEKSDKNDLDIDVSIDADELSWTIDEHPPFDKPHSLQIFSEHSNKGGFLGVESTNIKEQLKEYFGVKNGVLIEKVFKDTPAEKAKLRAGDVLLKINDRKIEDYADLIRILNYYNPGDKVSLKYSRKGKVSSSKTVLAKKEHKIKKIKKIIHIDDKHPKGKILINDNVDFDKLKHEFLIQGEDELKEIIII